MRQPPKKKLLKLAWIANRTQPGGRFPCPCNNAPLVDLIQGGPDIICNCGRRYDWQGCIKGRCDGSDTLTAYRVIFEDESEYSTAMAAEINLQKAYYYFIGMVIDGKTVVDVEPCNVFDEIGV